MIILGFVQSLLGAIVFLLRRPKHTSQIILGLWLITNGLLLFGGLFKDGIVQYFKPGVFPLLFLFGPFLYLYIKSLITEKFKFLRIHLLHLVPYLIVSIHRVFTQSVSYTYNEKLSEGYFFDAVYYNLMLVSIFIYWIISIVLILRHRKNILNHFSYKSRRITLNWTWMMVLINIFIFVFPLIFTSLFQFEVDNFFFFHFNLAIFSYLLTLFGLRQPIIFNQKNEVFVPTLSERKKYKRSGLDNTELEKIKRKIDTYLKIKKPYLNPEFNLQMMSEDLSISRQNLSQVLNERMNRNFYRLVNEFRVLEVKKRFESENSNHLTVIGIALESGFNSKASFNRIFKEITGTTPSGYKNELSASENN